jgi:hypothetical protein
LAGPPTNHLGAIPFTTAGHRIAKPWKEVSNL